MGLFKRKNTELRAEPAPTEDSMLSAMLYSSNVTRDMALQVPAIAGGIDLIANLIAETPIKLFRDGRGKAVGCGR